MSKQTTYSELRNVLVVVSFNQPAGMMGDMYQPVVIEARGGAITTEGAVRNMVNRVKIGEISDSPIINEELYKATYALSPVLAEALKGVLLDGVNEDMSKVSIEGVKPTTVIDIK